ncbi:MAG TPA: SDR family NAD(P)-dependent oxidoreductase [Gemmatimonadaceae bacterium]|nr:SDR family NAD(P)-dependent oxidoreductase [Gemmatimonadaceae bacterium]
MDLKNASVLVTGASCGIGFETALALRERGARVAICARHEQSLNAAAQQIGAIPIVADVSNEVDVVRLVQQVAREFDNYNVLINNAGFGAFGPLLELSAEEMLRVWQTNVLGAMLVARESARHFVGHGYGNIVNISSTAGQRGFPNGTAYVASKFALTGMTECWRSELRTQGVRVMQVNPSEVLTSFGATDGSPSRTDNPSKLHAPDVAHLITSMLELEDRGFITEATMWATNPR